MALELGLRRADVVDLEADVGRAEVVVRHRPRCSSPAGCAYSMSSIIECSPTQKRHLARLGARHADALLEVRSVEPRGRLVGEGQAEHVVVEADRPVEVAHDEADVVHGLELDAHAAPCHGQADGGRRDEDLELVTRAG